MSHEMPFRSRPRLMRRLTPCHIYFSKRCSRTILCCRQPNYPVSSAAPGDQWGSQSDTPPPPDEGAPMADFLDEKRKQITDRLRELKPAVDEYNRLEAAASALASVRGSASASPTARRRGPGRPRGSGALAKTGRTATATRAKRKKPGRPPGQPRPGRPKGTGARATQALPFVQAQPGITIPEL